MEIDQKAIEQTQRELGTLMAEILEDLDKRNWAGLLKRATVLKITSETLVTIATFGVMSEAE